MDGSYGQSQPSPYGIISGQNAEAPKKPHLYIGNLSPRVTDYMLTEIFAVAGPVVQAKIIPDRNFQHGGYNYGFVEYADMRSAEQALTTLNGRKIFDAEVRVNWAYQNQAKEDTQNHYHVFVGDLSPEVNDEVLAKAFGAFGSMSEARVMWDMNTGKSRGYGFLSFREKPDAEQAIATMNGEWLGSRAIRANWANQKTQTGRTTGGGPSGGSSTPGSSSMNSPYASGPGGYSSPRNGISAAPMSMSSAGGYSSMSNTPPPSNSYASSAGMSYDQVLAQTPEFNTTVYVGNLIPYATQADLIPLFQGYGMIVEIRMQADRGFAFIKLDSHQNAALAITQLSNQLVHGRPIKTSWGKDKEGASSAGVGVGGGVGVGAGVGMGGAQQGGYQQQMMNYPNYYNYGQYSYGQQGIPGQPGQAAQQAQHAQPADTQHAQQGQWDPAAAAAYYQSSGGWGGYYAQPDSANGQQTQH